MAQKCVKHSNLKLLSTHVDMLEVNLYGVLRQKYRSLFETLIEIEREKEKGKRGRTKDKPTIQKLRGHEFRFDGRSPYDMFSCSLHDEEFSLHVSFGDSLKSPTVKLKMGCLELIKNGSGDNWVESYVRVRHIVRELFEASRIEDQPSRVDIACDIMDFDMSFGDLDGVVTRAVNTSSYTIEGKGEDLEVLENLNWFARGRTMTGFSAGSGPMLMRGYNKMVELLIKSPDKIDGMMELWGAERVVDAEGKRDWLVDGVSLRDCPTWRFEAQIRRDKLRALRINTMQELAERTGTLWDYSTDWFSLRIPSDTQSQATRWKRDDRWKLAKSGKNLFSGNVGLDLEKEIHVPKEEKAIRLKQQFVGCMSSYAVTLGFESAGDLMEHLGAEQASWIPHLMKGIENKRLLNSVS